MFCALNKSLTLQGVLALFLWSTGAVTACFLAHIPAFEILGIVFAFAFLVILGITVKQKAWSNFNLPLKIWALVFLGIVSQQFFFIWAFKTCNPAEADIILYLWPLLAIIFARFFLNIRPYKRYYAAGVLGLMAVVVMSLSKVQGASLTIGHGYAFFSALCWSLYTTFARKFNAINLQIIGAVYGIGALIAFTAHITYEQFVPPSQQEILALIHYVLIATCAFNLWTNSMQSKKASLLTVSSYGKPLISILLLCSFGFVTPSVTIMSSGILITIAGLIAHGKLLPAITHYFVLPTCSVKVAKSARYKFVSLI